LPEYGPILDKAAAKKHPAAAKAPEPSNTTEPENPK